MSLSSNSPSRFILVSATLLLAIVSTLSAQTIVTRTTPPPRDRVIQIMQRRLDAARQQGDFPGAEVGFVYVDGETPDGKPKLVYGSVASGVADLKTKAPLKTSDRLLAGSIGKTFVATLTLMLVQDGKLKLDDKIEKWLGSQDWFSKLPNARDITLRMLLNHTSGIENHAEMESFQKQLLKNGAQNIINEGVIDYVLNKKPLFPAGTGYKYSDTNYILVGMIIERVTGKSLYDQISERILEPFKLERTIPSNGVNLPEVSNGYINGRPLIVNDRFTINPQWEWAGGGFASNAEDLARWAGVLYGGQVLAPTTLKEMFSSTSTGEGSTYGLGTMVARSRWGRTYGHDGEFPGYLSDMRYYQKYKIAIAVMVNSDETPGVMRFIDTATDEFAGIIISASGSRQISQADKMKFQALAEKWLGLVFASKFDESWELLSARLKARFPKDVWRSTMTRFIQKAGKFNSRTLRYIVLPNARATAVTVDFSSSFSNSVNASETMTFELENGEWKVASYSLH